MTCLVLAWLNAKHSAKKMNWKLLAKKSEKWLKKQGVD